MKRERLGYLADTLLIFLLTAVLIGPLFRLKYLENWGSIESTFISDGRFLQQHWPHPRWQPFWYCGTRFDYIYPPALRYGTAGIANVLGVIPAKAYHIYTAVFYCIGIAGVYVFARLGSRSRAGAWLAAAAAATISPAYLFLPDVRKDAWSVWLLPQRLNVLVRYGEGPHMSAFALLPLALAATWMALRGRRPAMTALAALLCALVVSNNFYGATALAMLYPILAWAVWITHRDRGIWLPAAAIPALAYGLTAFWLTPSYLRITLDNMKLVSQPGHAWSAALTAALALAFGWVSWRLAAGRKDRAWPVFVWGAAAALTVNVLGNQYFDFRVIGEPSRLVPELDLVLILLAVEGLRRMWRRSPAAAVALAAVALSAGIPYLTHPWIQFRKAEKWNERIEYRLTSWMARNLPGARALASGSVRFWYNAWHDMAQVGGGSEQGVLNQAVAAAQWDVMLGEDPALSVAWLQAMGADAVLVHDKRSQEAYHDFPRPDKFSGVLPVIYDNGEGDFVYRVPRRYPGLARVVWTADAARLKPVAPEYGAAAVTAYARLVEGGPDARPEFRYEGTDAMRVRAPLAPGQSLLVQASYDPAWRAWSGSGPLTVRRDAAGFMLIDAPPGDHDIRLVFELPLENAVGRVVSWSSAAVLVGLMMFRKKM